MSLDSAASILFSALSARGLTLAGAESCTGGLASSAFVGIPGASGVFLGSVVAYSNEAKSRLLSVSEATLGLHGAVSSECAREMAAGAARAFSASCAFAITGIAGPGGAQPGKPVGTVWLGYALAGETSSELLTLSGGRGSIRTRAAERALAGLAAFVAARLSLDNSLHEGVSLMRGLKPRRLRAAHTRMVRVPTADRESQPLTPETGKHRQVTGRSD